MQLLFGKQFSKDLDDNQLDKNLKKRLLSLIERMKNAESLVEMKDIKKIEGHTGYYRSVKVNRKMGKPVMKPCCAT